MPWNCIQCSVEISLMSTIIRFFAGCRSFRDVREGATTLLMTRGKNARARLRFCSAFALLLAVWETPQR
jgi:hypothetical protein